jgi:acetyl esterase/lipase
MSIKKISVAILLALFIIASCKKTDSTHANIALQTNIANVAYGNDPAQSMDIYLPPSRSTDQTKVIVLIHGGGWTSGDKSDFNPFVDTLQKRFPNYAIFNINYRLAVAPNTNLFPTQENDVKTAIEFIYSKRSEYFISDKFALIGASAGAHLALLQAYKYISPVRIKAVVDFFGPADMNAMFYNPTPLTDSTPIRAVMGAAPYQDSTLYYQSSPINYVVETSSPTIIFHGDADLVVRHEQSDSLYAKLEAANAVATYIKYPNQGHGWLGDTLTNSFNYLQTFLNANVK